MKADRIKEVREKLESIITQVTKSDNLVCSLNKDDSKWLNDLLLILHRYQWIVKETCKNDDEFAECGRGTMKDVLEIIAGDCDNLKLGQPYWDLEEE